MSERWIERDGVRLRALDNRSGSGTRDVLLLHGLASVARWWDLVTPHLVGAGLEPIALDQRGHGDSDKPANGYSYDDVIADAFVCIETLELNDPVVVGHSWGGSTALAMAALHPERIPGAVAVDAGNLVFLGDMTWEQAEEALRPPRIRMQRDELVEMLKAGVDEALWTDDVEDIVLSLFQSDADGIFSARFPFDAHMQVVRAMYDADVRGWLERLERPVLLLFARGGGEPGFDAAKEAFVESLDHPMVRTEWLENSIHDVPLQRPQLVAERVAAFCASL